MKYLGRSIILEENVQNLEFITDLFIFVLLFDLECLEIPLLIISQLSYEHVDIWMPGIGQQFYMFRKLTEKFLFCYFEYFPSKCYFSFEPCCICDWMRGDLFISTMVLTTYKINKFSQVQTDELESELIVLPRVRTE